MSMTSESDERMMHNNGVDSPSLDDANSGGDGGGGNGPLKKGPWTSAEDAILVEYVTKHGEGNWNAVQKHSGLARCGKSCRLRWANHLRPDLKKGAFTPEEERRIIELHAKMGNKWARMAAELPGRTDNEIKNYWNTRIKRRQRAGLPIYPPDICLQALNDNPQSSTDMISYSSGDVQHPEFMPVNNFDAPAIEFKNLDINQQLYPPALLDITTNSLLDIPSNNMLLQGRHHSYHDNKSLRSTFPPSKRLRGSEMLHFSSGINIVDGFAGGSQSQQFHNDHNSSMQVEKTSLFSGYDHILNGSQAVLNGNPSSEPAWAMKLELPSLQTQVGTWGSPSPSSPPPFFEPVDILVQTPPPSEQGQSCNNSNSGLLSEVIYESTMKKTSNDNSSYMVADGMDNPNHLLCDTEWEAAYNEHLSPLGHSSSSLFCEEPHPAETKPAKEEHDVRVEKNDMVFASSDFLFGSNAFGQPTKDRYLLKDAIGTILGEDLSRDCKKMDTGSTSSTQGHGHDSCAWNAMPTI